MKMSLKKQYPGRLPPLDGPRPRKQQRCCCSAARQAPPALLSDFKYKNILLSQIINSIDNHRLCCYLYKNSHDNPSVFRMYIPVVYFGVSSQLARCNIQKINIKKNYPAYCANASIIITLIKFLTEQTFRAYVLTLSSLKKVIFNIWTYYQSLILVKVSLY